jgi:hypothetical protein
MAKRRKTRPPIALLWTRGDQKRFIDAVERFVGLVDDLAQLMGELQFRQRRSPRRPKAEDMPLVANGHTTSDKGVSHVDNA